MRPLVIETGTFHGKEQYDIFTITDGNHWAYDKIDLKSNFLSTDILKCVIKSKNDCVFEILGTIDQYGCIVDGIEFDKHECKSLLDSLCLL